MSKLLKNKTQEMRKIIFKNIQSDGMMPLGLFWSLCLHHYRYGYYTSSNPFDDFLTAPETSQMFGEIIGAYIYEYCQRLSFDNFFLCELGAGSGKLLTDILRIFFLINRDFYSKKCLGIHIVDINPRFCKMQETALKDFFSTYSTDNETLSSSFKSVTWHKTLDTVPKTHPLILIANEFFDALPYDQFTCTNTTKGNDSSWSWSQICVGPSTNEKEFIFKKREINTTKPYDRHLWQTIKRFHPIFFPPKEADVCEISWSGLDLMQKIALRFSMHRGIGIIIDYGYLLNMYGNTFQALSHHEYKNPLKECGTQDLTCHVSFDDLARILQSKNKLYVDFLGTQEHFLKTFGIEERLAYLLKKCHSSKEKREINNQFTRLVHPLHMGELFKVMSFSR